jgi:hypothetical protein
MSFYSSVTSRASVAIKKRGTAMILRRTLAATIDPNTGAAGLETTIDYPCYGLIQYFDSKASALMYGTNTVKDSLTNMEEQMIMLSAGGLPVTPAATIDVLIYGGITYKVVNCLTLKPGNIPVIHNVHVRK